MAQQRHAEKSATAEPDAVTSSASEAAASPQKSRRRGSQPIEPIDRLDALWSRYDEYLAYFDEEDRVRSVNHARYVARRLQQVLVDLGQYDLAGAVTLRHGRIQIEATARLVDHLADVLARAARA